MNRKILKQIKDNKYILKLVALLVLVLAFFFFNTKDAGFDLSINEFKELKSKLLEEFHGAYPISIEPNGKVVELNMTASEDEIEIFEGYKTKVWAYNKSVPGPEIRIKLGDTLRINFKNKLPQETTIHFHGVRVPNAMDGVPGVTQEPIKPGEGFVYEFTPKDPGTFWFHPHVRSSEQVERGLFGTLIVEDEIDKKYSQDKVWVIDDWRITQDKQVYPYFNTPMDLMHDGRWGNVITVNAKLNETLKVRPGERIRLRLVNTSNARIYRPKFENLKATVIAVDGMYLREPLELDGLDLAPGNRIDLDISIPKDAYGKAFKFIDNFTGTTNYLASIQVQGEAVETPGFPFPKNSKVPNWDGAEELAIDKEYRLNARRKAGSGAGMMGEIEWTINDKAYPDYEPFSFKYGEINKFRFTNQSYRLHPMHLHGQFFKVVARDGKKLDEGFFRDTVLIYPKETVDLVTVPLDKGRWVSHCHILEHAEAGMMTVVEVE